jgi:hypothetical protein
MPKAMQPRIFRLAARIENAGRDHRRDQARLYQIAVTFGRSPGRREHEIILALRAGQLPFAEGVQDDWGQGDGAVPRFRFWSAEFAVLIDPLADMQFAFL